jgi:hypothetical protein
MARPYPPLNLEVRTPCLALVGATDELLEQALSTQNPYHSTTRCRYTTTAPAANGGGWDVSGRARARVDESFCRLHFVVIVAGAPLRMHDLIGVEFATFGTVTTLSWLVLVIGAVVSARRCARPFCTWHLRGWPRARQQARRSDNHASNRLSQKLGYEPNGTGWATAAAILR